MESKQIKNVFEENRLQKVCFAWQAEKNEEKKAIIDHKIKEKSRAKKV